MTTEKKAATGVETSEQAPGRFRKKPVVVDAFRWTPGAVLPDWLPDLALVIEGVLKIDTLEGVMTAQPGDWIIRGVKGECYPCKPDIFEATYERAGSAAAATVLTDPAGVEVNALLDEAMAKRGWPANPKECARIGWYAHRDLASSPVGPEKPKESE